MEPLGGSREIRSKTSAELLAEMTTLRDEAAAHGHDLDAMLEAVVDPMVVYDLQTEIVRCTPAFQAVLKMFSQAPNAATLQERARGLAMRDLHGDILPDEESPPHRMLNGEMITETDPAQIITRGESGVEGVYTVTGGPLYRAGNIIGAVAFLHDITEQHQLEEDFRQSEKRFRTLFELAPIAIYSCDADGVLQDYNTRTVELWGRAPHIGDRTERFCGSLRLYFPDGRLMPHDQCPLARTVRGETVAAGGEELVIERPDGARTCVIAHPQALRNERGTIVGAINCLYDMTERKEAEVEIRRANERFRLAQHAANGFVYEWDARTGLVYRSEGLERMLGYKPENIAPSWEAWAQLVYPGDWQATTDAEELAYLEALPGDTLTTEYRVRHRDGHYITVADYAMLERNKDGNVVRLIGQTHDISERKRTEEQVAADLRDTQILRNLGAQLVTEGDFQSLYQLIMTAAIALTHADAGAMQILHEDAQVLELLETQGFSATMTTRLARVDASSGASYGLALATRERAIMDFDVSDAEDPDGSHRMHVEAGYLSAQSTPLIGRSGKIVGMVSTHWHEHHRMPERELPFLDLLGRQAADVIERRQAEEALRRAHDDLEQRVADRTRQLDHVNNDLRRLSQRILQVQESERRLIARELHDEIGQQLTGVKMLLETLEESVHGDGGSTDMVGADSSLDRSLYAPHLSEISAAVGNALERVRDLSLDLRPAVLDSLGLLPALQWQFERYMRQTGVRVDFSADGLDRRLPARIEAGVYRVIQEALTNVARHAGVAEVTVQIYVTEETLTLYVVDRGAGFDVEEALATADSTGLAGMRERASLLGGTLIIDSFTGEGTTIQAEVSIAQAIELQAAHETEQERENNNWQTPENDAARHRARDELRDRARDQWRDAARDARRDTRRDALRDVTRDAARDRARDVMYDQQRERKQDQP